MKISEIIADKYKLRIPPTVYYDLLADVVEAEEDQEPCEDCISREQAIKQCGFGMTNLLIADCLRKLPSVTPKQKMGHWTYIRNSEVNGLKIVECSECGKRTYGSSKYCPNCGAKMEESE